MFYKPIFQSTLPFPTKSSPLLLIIKIYSATFLQPSDMHQKSAGSLNKSQIGTFVTDKIPEHHQQRVMGS